MAITVKLPDVGETDGTTIESRPTLNRLFQEIARESGVEGEVYDRAGSFLARYASPGPGPRRISPGQLFGCLKGQLPLTEEDLDQPLNIEWNAERGILL